MGIRGRGGEGGYVLAQPFAHLAELIAKLFTRKRAHPIYLGTRDVPAVTRYVRKGRVCARAKASLYGIRPAASRRSAATQKGGQKDRQAGGRRATERRVATQKRCCDAHYAYSRKHPKKHGTGTNTVSYSTLSTFVAGIRGFHGKGRRGGGVACVRSSEYQQQQQQQRENEGGGRGEYGLGWLYQSVENKESNDSREKVQVLKRPRSKAPKVPAPPSRPPSRGREPDVSYSYGGRGGCHVGTWWISTKGRDGGSWITGPEACTARQALIAVTSATRIRTLSPLRAKGTTVPYRTSVRRTYRRERETMVCVAVATIIPFAMFAAAAAVVAFLSLAVS